VRALNSILRSCRFCLTPAPALTGRFHDQPTGIRVGRSEGLALASLRIVRGRGFFRPIPAIRCAPNAAKLSALTTKDLGDGLQVSAHNPITGLDGRAALLARLGHTLLDRADGVGAPRFPRAQEGFLITSQRSLGRAVLLRQHCARCWSRSGRFLARPGA